jgi:lysophospholipase L1-like esterase
MYELIPGASGINSLGFRGPEVLPEKGPGIRRVIILGDSVAFGMGVRDDETFVGQLRELFRNADVEFINTAVAGYSTYNERQLLSERVLGLRPDLVIWQTCLNDIADPRFHVNAVANVQLQVPAEAIPQPDTVQRFAALPQVRLARFTWLKWSALFQQFERLVYQRQIKHSMNPNGRLVNGRWWPIFITGELPLDLLPWLDSESPEMQWFERQLGTGATLLGERGIPLVVLSIPLSYQLERGYPFSPQRSIEAIAHRFGADFVDGLALLTSLAPEAGFIIDKKGNLDVWHLSPVGHREIARGLEPMVREKLGL